MISKKNATLNATLREARFYGGTGQGSPENRSAGKLRADISYEEICNNFIFVFQISTCRVKWQIHKKCRWHMAAQSILIVDDDREMRDLLKDVLEDHGYSVAVAREGREALEHLERDEFLVVVVDLRMKGMDGAELLHELVQHHPTCNAIMMTAFGTVESAVDAMKRGAFDYLTKPIKTDELLVTIEKAFREASLRREVEHLRKQVNREYSFDQIFGKSKPMREVFDLIRRVADSQANILITGESGTGKELVAKAIHFNSSRKEEPFLPVNCAAIPEQLLESELFGHVKGAFTDARSDKRGLFEEAQKGTLFLDEISEMPMLLQAKLLRSVQEREIRRVGATQSIPVNVRIIASTNLLLAGGSGGQTISGRLVLPSERHRNPASSLARSQGRHSTAVQHVAAQDGERNGQAAGRHRRIGPRFVDRLPLAGQRAGIGKRDRTRCYPGVWGYRDRGGVTRHYSRGERRTATDRGGQ